VLVFISLIMGNPLQLIFNDLELIALIAGVIITAFVSEDGKSNWFEGSVLLTIYLILALGFLLID
jgi:Ca2+:H+ antiporter